MRHFKPEHTLEHRLKQIRLMEICLNVGQLFFLGLAMLHLSGISQVLQFDFVAYIFSFIVIVQFFMMKFLIVPMLQRKAHENLPDQDT